MSSRGRTNLSEFNEPVINAADVSQPSIRIKHRCLRSDRRLSAPNHVMMQISHWCAWKTILRDVIPDTAHRLGRVRIHQPERNSTIREFSRNSPNLRRIPIRNGAIRPNEEEDPNLGRPGKGIRGLAVQPRNLHRLTRGGVRESKQGNNHCFRKAHTWLAYRNIETAIQIMTHLFAVSRLFHNVTLQYCPAAHHLLATYKMAVVDYGAAVKEMSSGCRLGASWGVLLALKRQVNKKRRICEECRREMDEHHLAHGC
jgi:hypothetical protein